MDEILNLVESVSEGFPSYSFYKKLKSLKLHLHKHFWTNVAFFQFQTSNRRKFLSKSEFPECLKLTFVILIYFFYCFSLKQMDL